MNSAAVISALGAFGNSFAAATAVNTSTSNAECKVDFMIVSPLTGECEAAALCFAFPTDLLRFVMRRDYVGTCSSTIGRTWW
jgi:hypothetical protein